MLSRSRIFPTPPFSDSDIWVENFLENAQKFYDGGAWIWTPSYKDDLCQIKIGLVVLEKKTIAKMEKFTDGRTDNRRSERLTWAFSPGNLIKQTGILL
jgi:hypothetical protein